MEKNYSALSVQEAEVRRLQLTPVEWHAYRRCHKETAEHAQKVLPEEVVGAMAASGAVPRELDRELTHREADALFPKLVRLRQVRMLRASFSPRRSAFCTAVLLSPGLPPTWRRVHRGACRGRKGGGGVPERGRVSMLFRCLLACRVPAWLPCVAVATGGTMTHLVGCTFGQLPFWQGRFGVWECVTRALPERSQARHARGWCR